MKVRLKGRPYKTRAGEELAPFQVADLATDEALVLLVSGSATLEEDVPTVERAVFCPPEVRIGPLADPGDEDTEIVKRHGL